MAATKKFVYEKGLIGLSRVKNLLNELTPMELTELPTENIDEFVIFLLFELSDKSEKIDAFCKKITRSEINFADYSFDNLKDVCLGFFEPISMNVLSYVKILQKGLNMQKSSDLQLLLNTPKGSEFLEKALNTQLKQEE